MATLDLMVMRETGGTGGGVIGLAGVHGASIWVGGGGGGGLVSSSCTSKSSSCSSSGLSTNSCTSGALLMMKEVELIDVLDGEALAGDVLACGKMSGVLGDLGVGVVPTEGLPPIDGDLI